MKLTLVNPEPPKEQLAIEGTVVFDEAQAYKSIGYAQQKVNKALGVMIYPSQVRGFVEEAIKIGSKAIAHLNNPESPTCLGAIAKIASANVHLNNCLACLDPDNGKTLEDALVYLARGNKDLGKGGELLIEIPKEG